MIEFQANRTHQLSVIISSVIEIVNSMKLRKAYFVLGIITLYEYAYGKTTLPNESIQRYFEDYMNCAKLNNSSECLEITGAI